MQTHDMTVDIVGDTDIVIERTFAASPERLYAAFTDPAGIPQWWGPARYTTEVVEMDVRVGGTWRFVQRDEANEPGAEHAFFGQYYHLAPDRIVQTFAYEPFAQFPTVETMTLTPTSAGTHVRVVSTHVNRESRDAMAATDMESGARETWDRLAAIVEAGA